MLARGDVLIDGGNSNYHDDIRRADELTGAGIHYLDVGTSGGVLGFEQGYCLMIGGDAAAVALIEPVLATLAPGGRLPRPRVPRHAPHGRAAAAVGYLHCGPSGAGHFVKMVHNGIEYGLMAAYAEGLNLLAHADAGLKTRERGCRDRAARRPALLPVPAGHRRDRRSLAPRQHHFLAAAGSDGGGAGRRTASSPASPAMWPTPARAAGRWRRRYEVGVPAHVLSAALYSRFESRGHAEFADKLLSAMRLGFGGHVEKSS